MNCFLWLNDTKISSYTKNQLDFIQTLQNFERIFLKTWISEMYI